MATPRAPPQCPNSQSVATPVVRRERPNGLQRQQQASLEEQPQSGDRQVPQQPGSAQAAGGGSSDGDVTGPQRMELCCGEQLEGAATAAPHAHAALPASPPRPPRLALLPPAEARTPPRPPQQLGAEPGTPSPGTYKFGSPIGSPLAHAMVGLALGGSSTEPSPLSTPRCSILSSPITMPSPPLVPLSPRALQAMRPCSVRLSGSVRLKGNSITPAPPAPPGPALPATALPAAAPAVMSAVPAAVAHTVPAVVPAKLKPSTAVGAERMPMAPAPTRAASPQSSANAPGQWRREASFADLLLSAQRQAAPAPPVTARLAAAAASQLAAEMATSPRKRARKSLAPARAANSGDEAMLDVAAGMAGGLRRQGSFQDDSELQALAHYHKPAERR